MTDCEHPVRLHVESHGRGPALVLAHGLAGSARNFLPQARTFAQICRVWLYDARGHARSEAPRQETAYGWDCLIADFDTVVRTALDEPKAQTRQRAIVGGLSLGAATALFWTIRHQDLASGLVLAAYPDGTPEVRQWATDFADCIELEGLERAGYRYVWGPEGRFSAMDSQMIRRGILQHPPLAIAAVLRRAMALIPDISTILSALEGLKVPTLVVVGACDTRSVGPSRLIASTIPNARLAIIEGAQHVVNLSRPQAFDAVLADFLGNL